MFSDEAWNLSAINADNITALHQKYQLARVLVVSAEFDSPAFKQQARAYLEVSPTTVLQGFIYTPRGCLPSPHI